MPVDQRGNADIGLTNDPTTTSAFYSKPWKRRCIPRFVQGALGTQDEQAPITILSADLPSLVYSSLIGGPHIGRCGNDQCNMNGIAVAVDAAAQAFRGGNTLSTGATVWSTYYSPKPVPENFAVGQAVAVYFSARLRPPLRGDRDAHTDAGG